MVMLNAHTAEIPFQLPATNANERWETLIDTAHPQRTKRRLRGAERYELKAHSVAVLRLTSRVLQNRRKEDRITD
jgi:pullulanase/glycogen debranching enzyme